MQTVVQISLLALLSMIEKNTIKNYLSNGTPKATIHKTNSDTSSIQTCTWTYSDTPNSFLFDFTGVLTTIPRDHLVLIIKTSLPAHTVIRDIKRLHDTETWAELVLANPDENNAKSCMLHNQTRSILEHKGLYINALDVWIKPTLTLAVSEQVTHWRMQIFEFFPTDHLSLKRDEIASSIAAAISRAFYRKKGEKGTLHVKRNQVFFDVGKVTVLIEERDMPLVDPQRKLLFFPFLNRYLPIETTLIEK